MRYLVEKGLRYLFYIIIGASLVLVTTPSLAGAFAGSSAFILWPITGLLAYVLHLFEDTGKLNSLLGSVRSAGAKGRTADAQAGSPGHPGAFGQGPADMSPGDYRLEGSVLDVYDGVPFWYDGPGGEVGSLSVTAWLIDKGEISGTGVSDTALITVTTKEPGNVPKARRLILVDEDARPEVVRWVLDAFQGRMGGPLARLAAFAGEQVGFYQVPINYRLEESKSSLSVPHKVKVQAMGRRIPDSHPAGSASPWRRGWIGSGEEARVEVPEFQMVFTMGRPRAVRGAFRFSS